ncbi:MAG: hypothetical protein N2C14_31390, partial [Planctomycetales bacterium]
MNFALLGADETTLPMARAATQAGHRVTAAFAVGNHRPSLEQLIPDLQFTSSWEAMLDGGKADAVIVASGEEEERFEQLRGLLLAEVPALVAFPSAVSILPHYELEAVREDTGGLLSAYPALRSHPAIARIREAMQLDSAEDRDAKDSKNHQPLRQIVVDRSFPRRTRDRVIEQFIRDVDWLRALCGELLQVNAMAPGVSAVEQNPQYDGLGVQLSGPSEVIVRWSAGPVEEASGAKIVLWGDSAKATLLISDDQQPWKLNSQEGSPEKETEAEEGGEDDLPRDSWEEEFPEWDPWEASIERLVDAMKGDSVAPTWLDSVRALELAEAVERSLIRRRMIELRVGEHSEEAAFKGTMAVAGCGMLLAMLVVFLLS